jgi:MYXO-CTERM domain-containing protein/uncharacterized repeat protein (TIGR01451 family)
MADGVAQVLTSKSIPPATVAVIDPETGTSSGGGTTDVKVGAGDIILFRFKYFPVPDHEIRGLQGYLTEMVPPNTQVVGVRIIDANGVTITPRFPGLADDGCARTCNKFNSVPAASGTRNLDDGSISQVYADTGVFYATAGTLARNPANTFLTLTNGILMSPEPTNLNAIIGLIGTASPVYSHNAWDWTQVRAYGIPNSKGNFSGNSGTGNTPFLYGSPVAGPQTYYQYEATEVSPGVIQFNDVVGPWGRIKYPGSQIGSGPFATGTGSLARTNIATTSGFDVTPANPLPLGTRAVRFALGEVRVGEPGFAEIALRVNGSPLDPVQNDDVDCAETFGGDTSGASDTVRARDNAWATYLASPACVHLNLLFDLTVDKALAQTGDVLTYTLHGKNLSVNTQTGAVPTMSFDPTDVAYVAGSATGGATVVANCHGDGRTCLVWPSMTLAPSAEYTFTAQVTVGGTGHVTNVMFANYTSNQLPAPGFTTQAATVVRSISVVHATLQAMGTAVAGATEAFAGTLSNDGSGVGSYSSVGVVLPAGWTIPGAFTLGGVALTCASGCGTNAPTYTIATQAFNAAESRAISFAASVPGGTAAGLYTVDLQVWSSQTMFGGTFETYFPKLATVAVGSTRSAPPVVSCPIGSIATSIPGTTTEANGTVVRVYFNGIPRGTATATNGAWVSTDFTSFGPLYSGLEVRTSAQGPGRLESDLSPPCFVSLIPQCEDGIDNDGDGLIDYPSDPGCSSPIDNSETDVKPQCSDGIDNDGDNLIDYPADPGCSSPTDNTEAGPPACSDGVDNDGDGLIDYPADPGCTSPSDVDETSYPACSDGLDNDGDGKIDYPADPGCHSSNDNSEVDGAFTTTEVKPRMLIAFDTSGSMNWTTCASDFTGGDGSAQCPGGDVACATCGGAGCGDGKANDSRLFKVKDGITQVVDAFGEVDYGLMRFHQRSMPFACPTTNASLSSGGWQGSYLPPCGGGFSAGDLLVSFDPDNRADLLQWMDGSSNYPGTPPPGLDTELRATGTTPLAGILGSALDVLGQTRAADARGACRPYRVVLVTDGDESCGGDPVAAAAALKAAGIKVSVIGFATPDPTMQANLNAIAAAGGTGSAVIVDDSVALSSAIATIVSDSILIERCNGVDDNCNGIVDEGFPVGATCSNGQLGACARTSTRVCSADGLSTVCNAPAGTPGTETCPPNGIDDDCNGVTDDVPGGCPTCTPEVCNGLDDDCNGTVDDLAKIFPCPTGAASPANCACPAGKSCTVLGDLPSCWCPPACGSAVGICKPGILQCSGGKTSCVGGTAPGTEVCDGQDNDCDGIIDGLQRACYPAATPGCDTTTGKCVGICRLGAETCPRLSAPAASNAFGACMGAIKPQPEICNGLDDDCNGMVDDVPGGCDKTCIPKPEICNGLDDNCNGIVDDMPMGEGDACVVGFDPALANTPPCHPGRNRCVGGVFHCEGAVGPSPEICDGKDNDCDGKVDVGATCPDSFTCLDGACQPLCQPGEFPCAADRSCLDPTTRDPCRGDPKCVCLPNACLPAGCDPASQTCTVMHGDASCVDRCPPGKCPAPTVCLPSTGQCLDCYATGCPAGKLCLGAPGVCKVDACDGVTCAAGEMCADGACKASCANVTCPAGSLCMAGTCHVNACASIACSVDKVCNPDTGACEANHCVNQCPLGTICVPKTGACEADACMTARCPACSRCEIAFDGTASCVNDKTCGSVTITEKGGGCGCATGAATPRGSWPSLVLALGVVALARRRRRRS